MEFTPTKSVKACPNCRGHLWECCFMVSPSEIYIEQESATPIVDGELGDSDYVDFCVKCGCGVTSHEFSKEEITDG